MIGTLKDADKEEETMMMLNVRGTTEPQSTNYEITHLIPKLIL